MDIDQPDEAGLREGLFWQGYLRSIKKKTLGNEF